MRTLLIAASVLLAGGNLLPMMTGHGAGGAARAVARQPVPVRVSAPRAVSLPPAAPALMSCARRHAIVARRSTGGAACQAAAMDAWDLCEATGMWPA